MASTSKRQVVLDTETTGLDSASHKIIEIGCIELIGRRMTGKHFHRYLNPERPIDPGAQKVHGISLEFLRDKPKFVEIVEEFITFIDDAELIIHNAPFDIGFLNSELQALKPSRGKIEARCSVFDTLVMARAKHPGQKNNLDALCKRYEIDNSKRSLHGALMDADILAHLYLAMTTEQNQLFEEAEVISAKSVDKTPGTKVPTQPTHTITAIHLSEEEEQAHREYIAFLRKTSGNDLLEW